MGYEYILSVRNLVMDYAVREGNLRIADNACMDIAKGKVNALIGESGCGKTSLIDAMMNTIPPNAYIRSGEVLYKGKNILALSHEEQRKIRWEKIPMVFQAAQNALNPVMKISEQMVETVQAHRTGVSKEEMLKRASELLDLVHLNPHQVLNSFPHELSGGMKQRTIIAMSLLLDPELIILDEPTSALDLLTQAYINDLIREIQEKEKVTFLLVTHDIAIVAEIADRVNVMYAAKILEVADVDDLFYDPRHPYTIGLLNAIPSMIGDIFKKKPIPGSPPSLLHPPPGCRFHPRCPHATEICEKEEPELRDVGGGRLVACHMV